MNFYVTLNDENFDKEVVESKNLYLVDFWAPWCAPCKMVGPIIEQIAEEYQGKIKVGKFNVDENQEKAIKYGIRSIPTIILFKDGLPYKQIIGFQPKESIVSLFKDLI